MSWLFGLRNDPNSLPPSLPTGTGSNSDGSDQQPNDNSGQPSGTRNVSEAYRFDSSALERAAQAAKDLEKSSNELFFFKLLLFYST